MHKLLQASKKTGPGGGITARQAKLAKCLADPAQVDRPVEEMAQECGISVPTLYRWRNLPQVQEAVQKALDKYLITLRPYAIECLKERMAKDTQALKLFFELDKQYVRRTEITGEGGGPVRLAVLAAYSEKQLEQMREELQEKSNTTENVIDVD